MKINYNSSPPSQQDNNRFNYLYDVDKNIEYTEKFIKNFNDVYEKENQSFFIKICQGDHKKYIAFIFHPINSYHLGNHCCPVYLDQKYETFITDFELGFKIMYRINKKYVLESQ